ncbi:MAG: polyphosphate kinase 1 [Lachnospiraceae bacterium]|nr:polyphosphate kinase 1 [Lachnospiraceae bacterium]
MKKEKTAEKDNGNTYFSNRELSWLSFNERVLDEASNPRVPLAERLTFASIFQTNLDEFFMVRVGTLMTQMNSKIKIRDNKTNMTSKQQVKAILNEVKRLEKRKSNIFEQIMGELEPKGIRLINFNKLSDKEGTLLEEYFDTHIAPFLSPMIIGKEHPFPFLVNKELYTVVLLSTIKGKKKIGIVPCKNTVFKRLIEIPTRPGTFMLSEELILHFISKLYPKYTVREKSIMRVTRNADIDGIEIDDEDMNYRDVMEKLIKKRNKLMPVRVELSREINKDAIEELSNYLAIGKKHFIIVGTPLDLSFVFQLKEHLKDKKELFYPKKLPRNTNEIDIKQSILKQIEKKDLLLSYPYESMTPFLHMLEEAAHDDKVISIKMTLYRVAERSRIIDSLIEAAENGKEVVVLVELRARFDEANNIEMSRRLEEAGCQILYGLEEYKVHCKLCLITKMNENMEENYYVQIGTGNYNEKTSRLYTDLSLMTSNRLIGKEVAQVFNTLQKGEIIESSDLLLVAPKCLQSKIIEFIEAEKAKGENGYIGVKVNSLTDKVIIDKLVEASQAGVKIELLVRGICCLKPGITNYTENIRVVSIVGRFLEHSRIYIFGADNDRKVYIASADFMTRNTTKRVEVAVPLLDEQIRNRVTDLFQMQFEDDEKGKEQNSFGEYKERNLHEEKIDTQMQL